MPRALIGLLLALCILAPAHAAPDDGFVPIFDGKTLEGWEGDPTYWRVEQGKLVGEVTLQTLLKRNSFIIWRGGELEDFELKIEYRVSKAGNSGVNYRSVEVPGVPLALRGYQADIHGGDDWTGNNYEERGRTFLALRGQKTVLHANARPTLIEQFGSPEELQAWVRKEDWNSLHILARGNHIQHYINGRLMSEVIDNDPVAGQRRGLLGVQVHVGPPMKVEYRNILLRRFPADEPAGHTPRAEGAEPVTFDNPSALADLNRQRLELLAPPPAAAFEAGHELTVESEVRYACGRLTDLVLMFKGKPLKIPDVPEELGRLRYDETFRFDLQWDDGAGAYRVRRATLGGKAIYLHP